MIHLYDDMTERLRAAGDWLAPLGLRLILFWEFWEAGAAKFNGGNWFDGIQGGFPPPFGWLAPELNWLLATWTELMAAIALLIGLFTRFFAFALLVLTAVATLAVHWPDDWGNLAQLWQGYAITNAGQGNFKLPLIFMVMLLPLVFMGGGKLSVDHLLVTTTGRGGLIDDRRGDMQAFGVGCLVIGIPLVYLMPIPGLAVLAVALVCLTYPLVR